MENKLLAVIFSLTHAWVFVFIFYIFSILFTEEEKQEIMLGENKMAIRNLKQETERLELIDDFIKLNLGQMDSTEFSLKWDLTFSEVTSREDLIESALEADWMEKHFDD